MKIEILGSLFDEMEKIAASYRTAGYLQSRSGIRPIRVHNLLDRDLLTHNPEVDRSLPAEAITPETEHSQGDELGKTAADEGFQERAMGRFDKVRPYVAGAIKAGVPAAVFGKILAGEGARAMHTARVMGLLGAAAGVGNESVKNWAEKHKRTDVAKRILKV